MKIISFIAVLFWLTLAIGWITNIVKFAEYDFKPSYKAEIIRGIGIIAVPIGGVIGYLNIKDEPTTNP